MEKIEAELTLQEWKIVLHALSRMPFGDVAALIFSLKSQVEEKAKQEKSDVN